MPQPIQLRHTVSPTNTPDSADGTTAHLLAGEAAVAIAPAGVTKLWVGDAAANRLLLSTVDTDTPIMTAPYAKLNGATFTGAVIWTTAPSVNGHLANKEYVDTTVASGQLYQGTYDASTNDPDITVTANQPTVNGGFFIVSVGGTLNAGVPGVGGQTVNPGDHLVWNDTSSDFSIIPAGGMTQADADLRYLRLAAANTMATGGTITMPTGYAPTAGSLQVATAAYADSLVTGMLTAVEVDGLTIDGDGTTTAAAAGVGPLRVIAIDGGTF